MARKKQKRSYGLGRVFLRGKIWWAEVYDGEGKKLRRSSKSENREDAVGALAGMLRERSRGELVAVDSPATYTAADLLEEYLRRRGKLAPKTLGTYRSQIDLHLKPYFGLFPVAKLTTDVISDYRDQRAKQNRLNGSNAKEGKRSINLKKMSDTSINREVGLLRSAMREMAKRRPGLIPSLPYFPMETERNARQGFISEEHFAARLYAELPRHLQALTACAFYVGGRKSEWLRLDWEDVDFEQMVIRFTLTKNKHPREVPIVPGLMLDSLLDALKLHNAAWPNEKALFVYDGQRMAGVGDAWDKAAARAGYEGLLFHDLRRSANKNMRDRGITQGVRMKIMGHFTPSMDIRYGIVDLDDIKDAGQKMGRPREPKLKRLM